MFLDVAPTEYRGLQFGFPLPIFHFSVELWSSGQLYSNVLFIWVGALLDMVFYVFIVGVVFLVGSEIARTIKARKSRVAQLEIGNFENAKIFRRPK
jgi:hypothetical protein